MAKTRKKDTRPQINVRVDDELLEIIQEIRRTQSPIPNLSDTIRMALRYMAEHEIHRAKSLR